MYSLLPNFCSMAVPSQNAILQVSCRWCTNIRGMGSPTLLWQRAASVVVVWFAGLKLTNSNNCLPKLLWKFYSICKVYKYDRTPHIATWRAAAWRPAIYDVEFWNFLSTSKNILPAVVVRVTCLLKFLEEHYVRIGSHACLSHGYSISTSITYFDCVWFNDSVSNSSYTASNIKRLVSTVIPRLTSDPANEFFG